MLAFFFCVCLTANGFVCKLKLCSMWNWNLCTRGKVCERGGALCWFVGIWIAGGQVGHSRQRSLMQILTQFQIPKRNVFSSKFLVSFMLCFVNFMNGLDESGCKYYSFGVVLQGRRNARELVNSFLYVAGHAMMGFLWFFVQGCVGSNCSVSGLLLAASTADVTLSLNNCV